MYKFRLLVFLLSSMALLSACNARDDAPTETQATDTPLSEVINDTITEQNEVISAEGTISVEEQLIRQEITNEALKLHDELIGCNTNANSTYETAKSSGISRSEARRAADEAQLACEEPVFQRGQLLAARAAKHPACLGLSEVADFSSTITDGALSSVRFLCNGANGIKLFERTEPISFDNAAHLVESYLTQGPTEREIQQGHGYVHRSLGKIPVSASITDGVLTVDFYQNLDAIGDSANMLTQLEVEIGANAFQFPDVFAVQFTLNGSCEAMWSNTLYGECRLLTRDKFLSMADGATS